MAPAKRTSSHFQSSASKDQKKKKNTTATTQTTAAPAEPEPMSPHNSITVAHRTMPPPGPHARSSSASSKVGASSPSSSHSSPPLLTAIKEKAMPTPVTNDVEMKSPHTSKNFPVTSIPSPKNSGVTVSLNKVNGTGNDIPQATHVQTKSTPVAPKKAQHQPQLHSAYSFEFCTNIDEITMRQLEEDIAAYHNDMAFVHAQLADETLTPQESRTFQLRLLDLGHQIRHCRHRIELIQFQNRKPTKSTNLTNLNRLTYASASTPSAPVAAAANGVNGTSSFTAKQHPDNFVSSIPMTAKRPAEEDEDEEMTDGPSKRAKQSPSPGTAAAHVSNFDLSTIEIVDTGEEGDTPGVNTLLQRLGFWKCRLCCSTKYLLAGSGRSPAAPCKWPLKDISKMITHFTEMHSEHSVNERCYELGAALAKNRGPFEYWLRRTRNQNLGDGKCIDEAIFKLVNGQMPALLRLHSRAAAGVVMN